MRYPNSAPVVVKTRLTAGDAATARLASFTLHNGSLCSCTIEAEIPLPIATPGGTEHGMLTARLELGSPTPKGASIGSV